MKLSVPVIKHTDVLIIGGTVKAAALALDLRAQGLTVFCATPYSYFGEDLCATLDLQSPKSPEFVRLFGTDAMLKPLQIKRTIDKHFVDAGIDFLFQLRPIRPLYTADGTICGALFADRSGFHAVAAKVVIDATARATFIRAANIPTKPFVPSTYTATMYTVGGANAEAPQLRVATLPETVTDRNETFAMYKVERDIYFAGNTGADYNKALVEFRKAAWHPDLVAVAEQIVVDLNDGIADDFAPDSATPVFALQSGTAASATARDVAELAKSLPAPAPASFKETAVAHDSDIVRKDKFYRYTDAATVEFDLASIPQIGETDVFVAGGGTGGAPAAIGAARAGMRVICAENLCALGGIMTLGRINCYYYGNRVGFTKEIDTRIFEMGDNPKYPIEDPKTRIEWKSEWFLEQAGQAGAEIRFDTMCVAVSVDGNIQSGTAAVTGVVVASPFGIGLIKAKCVIDASGNADIAAMAGADIACDMQEEAAVQGVGLSPVNISEDYTNTDYMFALDSDVLDTTRAFVMARAKFADNFDMSTIVNSRERRRIEGDIMLQPQDFFANRTYADTINIAYSNFDTHGFIVHPLFMLKPTNHDTRYANVPLRALLPRGWDNLLVTGLGVSAHRDCMPLIRMQPDVQNQGLAAGYAAAMKIAAGTPIRDINVRELQRKLVAEGHFPERVLTEVDAPCVVLPDDDYHDMASIFLDTDKAKADTLARLAANPDDLEAATILAFLGDPAGKDLLVRAIAAQDWDDGWDYRGMGQFGPSMSPLDARLVALSVIGGDAQTTLDKLRALTGAHAFSHHRAVALSLIRNPDKAAVPALEQLLTADGASGHAIDTMEKNIAANRPDYNDTTYRNAQLKEVYLAKALVACDPASALGTRLLASYANGWQGLYTLFAKG